MSLLIPVPSLALDDTQIAGIVLARYVASVASWVAQGDSSVAASAGATGSIYVPAETELLLDGSNGAYVAAIDAGTAGEASLAPLLRL